jgi:hypothetical protein
MTPPSKRRKAGKRAPHVLVAPSDSPFSKLSPAVRRALFDADWPLLTDSKPPPSHRRGR